MENINFSFNTVIGLLGAVIALCVYIVNRIVADQKMQAEKIDKNEEDISNLRELCSKAELCIRYIKRDIEELKK